ncbi:hypothetical protein DCO58_04000 [Helicobacter saguini]|uniref:Uncharacterized protein n=1 Tax=Helicobacter saguini TaxID=1548018 RepID=A0A347VSJ5_9HELI|nr:hypothetical protein [Helicobacter saguini]MWV62481.1 hypothetical protein [Helicobacter saguini]MWV66846.1 hypothetical protein [Helicobacter saguini]MWV69196.1 hypothetical protein [Helicobacter saguini]MWV71249.1 hypothetical protein [Helicobacter saguini]TLD94232.1 hypothetical protein LS64_007015 [Helicobacter saguini]
MNKYDIFTFDIACINDTNDIMEFIKSSWDANHILANNKDFFIYHYKNLFDSTKLNVFLMRDKNGKIKGMSGFVPQGKDNLGIYFSGSVTKVSNDIALPMSGLELLKRFYKYLDKYVELACGANEKTIVPLFKNVFHYKTGVMDLYFLPNLDINEYKIIKFDKTKLQDKSQDIKQYTLHRIYNLDSIHFDFNKRYDKLPFKDKRFLEHRYFQHPIFDYLVYAIKDDDKILGIVFFRLLKALDSNILFLIDYVGDINALSHIKDSITNILKELNAECVHFLVGNLDKEIPLKAGFNKVDIESSNVIIPTYFEPFLQKNIRNIYVTSKSDMIIFKAYGDQDNPKYIKDK